ncbi:MAG: transcription elongation factor GreA [Muribaculaceae bacterium]|nr:transcription elongation factor GreA [Muribaculaceae bacterium]MBQ1723773.1 transcription elongation factor GreA [Muribaculaceae bacterium]MBQ2490212.1 transcription elongation factor GreA [Muribaculaceae bacterium]MBQ3961290.1 transcription elongation factor GreA [Muribaculaceae bacterium]MBQ4006924.1 transcription elongation factor GreA [Muribaculaceae bacterium]
MAITYMTKEGFDKKMKELARLENEERPEVVRAIVEAREKGDLSENAEYDAAKERQGMLEAKIAELKNLVANARIIDETKIQTDEVQLLNRVTIKNVKNKATMTYTIVTETEANLRENKISIATPIAKGLLGHKVGDVVEVTAPAGVMKFEILKIEV